MRDKFNRLQFLHIAAHIDHLRIIRKLGEDDVDEDDHKDADEEYVKDDFNDDNLSPPAKNQKD